MNAQREDLSIDEVLADPVIGTVMKADRVDAQALRGLLERARDARIRRARCFSLPLSRSRTSRPWAHVTPPPAADRACEAPRAW